jgi:hypothetical protein
MSFKLELLKDAETEIWQWATHRIRRRGIISPFSSDDIAGFVVLRTSDIEICALALEVYTQVRDHGGSMKLKA